MCYSETPKSDLRKAMTMNIDRKLNEYARTLIDGNLLATLSDGDAVAQELKYHKKCLLSSLYYRESAHLSILDGQKNCGSLENEVYPLVFSELVTFIVESKSKATDPIVFCLADLVKMFKQRL
ncbi:hypothetical protein DPMN_173906 [Dreissena polymorpha]|uniref:Uncharacterized protein n=1 Tax=Dreissena polymorpha TaxID=45954 RepID=A0A9D4IFY5_DREPO|nr:hypothetical protein DPMN_173906 [Dreissena polymorpha]